MNFFFLDFDYQFPAQLSWKTKSLEHKQYSCFISCPRSTTTNRTHAGTKPVVTGEVISERDSIVGGTGWCTLVCSVDLWSIGPVPECSDWFPELSNMLCPSVDFQPSYFHLLCHSHVCTAPLCRILGVRRLPQWTHSSRPCHILAHLKAKSIWIDAGCRLTLPV